MCISGPVEPGPQPASDDMQAPEKKHNLPSFLCNPSSATATSFCSCLGEAETPGLALDKRSICAACSTLLSKKHNRNIISR